MQRARLDRLLDSFKEKPPLKADEAYPNYQQTKENFNNCLNSLDKIVKKLNTEQLQILNLKRNK